MPIAEGPKTEELINIRRPFWGIWRNHAFDNTALAVRAVLMDVYYCGSCVIKGNLKGISQTFRYFNTAYCVSDFASSLSSPAPSPNFPQ